MLNWRFTQSRSSGLAVAVVWRPCSQVVSAAFNCRARRAHCQSVTAPRAGAAVSAGPGPPSAAHRWHCTKLHQGWAGSGAQLPQGGPVQQQQPNAAQCSSSSNSSVQQQQLNAAAAQCSSSSPRCPAWGRPSTEPLHSAQLPLRASSLCQKFLGS